MFFKPSRQSNRVQGRPYIIYVLRPFVADTDIHIPYTLRRVIYRSGSSATAFIVVSQENVSSLRFPPILYIIILFKVSRIFDFFFRVQSLSRVQSIKSLCNL